MNVSRGAATGIFSLTLLLVASPARAQIAGEFFFGTAFNVPSTLTITQAGLPPIEFTAHYDVRPTDDRWYYAYRFELWKNDRAWIGELVHHKLYLNNPQSDVQAFEITHGYNLITLNRGFRFGQNILLFGGGIVLAYPHSTVRGQIRPYGDRFVSGVTMQGAAARRFDLTKHVFASVEGKLTASWAKVPVVDGHATVPNGALHVLAGLGAQF